MVFLKISQNLQESTCVRGSVSEARSATLLKKRLRHRCFPVNFAKFLSTFFIEHLLWLLLSLLNVSVILINPGFKNFFPLASN